MSNLYDLEAHRGRLLSALRRESTFGTVEIVDGHIRINVQGDYEPGAAEALARQIYVFAGQIREAKDV